MANMINSKAPLSGLAKLMAMKGRKGDTKLAHINPMEAKMLEAMGGAGTTNPSTGLPEYWGAGEGSGTSSDNSGPSSDSFGGGFGDDGNYGQAAAAQQALSSQAANTAATQAPAIGASVDDGNTFGGITSNFGGHGGIFDFSPTNGSNRGSTTNFGKSIEQGGGTADDSGVWSGLTSFAGGLLGLMVGGPLGAMLGAGVGNKLGGGSTGSSVVAGLGSINPLAGLAVGGINKAGRPKDDPDTPEDESLRDWSSAELSKTVTEAPKSAFDAITTSKPSRESIINDAYDKAVAGGANPGTPSRESGGPALFGGTAFTPEQNESAFGDSGGSTEPKRQRRYIQQRDQADNTAATPEEVLRLKQVSNPDYIYTPGAMRTYAERGGPSHFKMVQANTGGGLSDLYNMNEGGTFSGMVKGPDGGDGMSDDVAFDIKDDGQGGPDKALLSKDEYVIDAHSMSLLGNGSSDAGADQMDKFIKDLRKSGFGTTKQPKQLDGAEELSKLL